MCACDVCESRAHTHMMHMQRTGQLSEAVFLLPLWAPRIKFSALACWAILPALHFVYFQTESLVAQADLKFTTYFKLALDSWFLHLYLSAIPCLACIFSLSLNLCSLNMKCITHIHTCYHIHCCCCCSSYSVLVFSEFPGLVGLIPDIS